MRASRLVGLLGLLQARGRMSARQLAHELEVSERTILRDIEALGAAGIPLYAIRGCSGGFELIEGFRSDLPAAGSPRHPPRPTPGPRGHGSACPRAAAASRRCWAAGRYPDPPEQPRGRRA